MFENHPAAWDSQQLLQRAQFQQSWTAEEIAELRQAVQQTAGMELAAAAAAFRSPKVAQRMLRIQDDLENGPGAVWLRGWGPEPWEEDAWQRLFWGLSCQVGTPVSQSVRGERLFHVRDEGFHERDAQARGPNTRKRLSFHTDRCDVIGFLCLQDARRGGENDIVSSVSLFHEIGRQRPDLLRVLQSPFYYQRHNVDHHHPKPYVQQPVFSVCQGHFAANLLRVLIERAYAMPDTPEMTPQQREALDLLEAIAEQPQWRVQFRQSPGDLLLLNNFVTLHRRSEFEDHPEPQRRRHLLRIWLSVPNSRPLDAAFADNYGSTAAGAVRGGMRPQAAE